METSSLSRSGRSAAATSGSTSSPAISAWSARSFDCFARTCAISHSWRGSVTALSTASSRPSRLTAESRTASIAACTRPSIARPSSSRSSGSGSGRGAAPARGRGAGPGRPTGCRARPARRACRGRSARGSRAAASRPGRGRARSAAPATAAGGGARRSCPARRAASGRRPGGARRGSRPRARAAARSAARACRRGSRTRSRSARSRSRSDRRAAATSRRGRPARAGEAHPPAAFAVLASVAARGDVDTDEVRADSRYGILHAPLVTGDLPYLNDVRGRLELHYPHLPGKAGSGLNTPARAT